MGEAAWHARRMQAKDDHIKRLHDQITGYSLQLRAAKQRIEYLTTRLAETLQADADTNPLHLPRDRIFLDIVQNRARPKNGRRYSPETLRWAWAEHQQSAAAWTIVREALPLPCERILQSHFVATGAVISHALVDLHQIGQLVNLWNQSSPDTAIDRRIVLSVDAVAFRPRVVLDGEGEVKGLEDLTKLESPDLFQQFLLDPHAFTSFLRKHWSRAYSALFAFQIQPLQPHLPCCIVHAWPHCNGKGDPKVVKRLLKLRAILERDYGFQVLALGFDGDSAYNGQHNQFTADYRREIVPNRAMFGISLGEHLLSGVLRIICDPKHLVKRVRYRFVHGSEFSIGFGVEDIRFSLDRIKAAGFLPPVVFENSRITKMHDSLPLELFSPVTFACILEREWAPEMVLAPWCLLTTALIIPGFNTRTRCDMLEIGFWFLFLYQELLATVGLPWGVVHKITSGRLASLYSADQLRDCLNSFISIIAMLRESHTPICLNRLGSDPLEHSFGQARIRCWDVNTMEKMLAAFSFQAESISRGPFLELLGSPHRRHSIGITCDPWSTSPPSEFHCEPFDIAVSLFEHIGIDLTRILQPRPGEPLERGVPYRAWWDLKRLKAFTNPLNTGVFRGTVFMSLFGHVHDEYTANNPRRTLCSDQLFLGIMNSPRSDRMNTAASKMRSTLGTDFPEIADALDSMYGRRLNVRDLEHRVHVVAVQLEVPPPSGRTREDYLGWLHEHAPRSMELLQRMIQPDS
jgi:hypothetical protein